MSGKLKLDNPVWYSLSETHKELSINSGHARLYQPDYCIFGAAEDQQDMSAGLDAYAEQADNFYIVGERPTFSKKLVLDHELVCFQMVAELMTGQQHNETITPLNGRFEEALYHLVNLVQPGFFRKKTAWMGNYYGIFKDDQLVAATGERMKMDGFTEISAVVTHPQYTGRGYAKQLVQYTATKIFSENKIPYLHVNALNTPAIKLYEGLGFQTRRTISFWHLRK